MLDKLPAPRSTRPWPVRSRVVSHMPTFEIITGALDQQARHRLARQISSAAAEAGQPADLVKVVSIQPESVFIHGHERSCGHGRRRAGCPAGASAPAQPA